jgi:protease I
MEKNEKNDTLKIAVLIDEDFEDTEYSKPAAAYKQARYSLVHVGLKKGKTVQGKHRQAAAQIDESAHAVSVNDFDAIFIPGGYSPDHLRIDPYVVSFVKHFVQSGKPVLMICHAPQLLITAQVLQGRKITGWKSIIQDIKNAGAEFIDQEVVEDGNLISSRSPRDIPAFIQASLRKLKNTQEVRKYGETC